MATRILKPSIFVEGPMPVTTDSLLLADFVQIESGQRILDLGAGSGAIALTLAARRKVEIVGIDVCIEAIEEASRRWQRDRALMLGECVFEPGDMRNREFMEELGLFDQVVCNPPYFKANQGRLPPDPVRAAARHEVSCTLEDIVRAAGWVLREGGVFSFVHIPPRLPEAFGLLSAFGFQLSAIQPIYTRKCQDAELALIQAVKGENASLAMRILPPRGLRALCDGR
ncbi:MAG: tRNA1(Val) (adenine(37)-N6)-methyltransferase [candidate division BRC1 bacterium ADurb.BinA364]|nr:MAG: tRNA1(Val) (adenine(37)-N6)-methyltransferase [candidate division BRC1 bacterium ADurb.BinA364]